MSRMKEPFEVRVFLGFGEHLVFENCTIVNENECDDVHQLTWISESKRIEYLPYWKWFWEEIFDLDTLRFKSCGGDGSIFIDGIEIPFKTITFKVVQT